jgi:hypothetical protein
MIKSFLLVSWLAGVSLVFVQGTFIYDQVSGLDGNYGAGLLQIPLLQPAGQSFTPTSSAINFIRLGMYDGTPGNGLYSTVYVNLRADSITGTILSSTSPVTTADIVGAQPLNFFFPSTLTLTQNVKYYFDVIITVPLRFS